MPPCRLRTCRPERVESSGPVEIVHFGVGFHSLDGHAAALPADLICRLVWPESRSGRARRARSIPGRCPGTPGRCPGLRPAPRQHPGGARQAGHRQDCAA
jgi:hypothetical protein